MEQLTSTFPQGQTSVTFDVRNIWSLRLAECWPADRKFWDTKPLSSDISFFLLVIRSKSNDTNALGRKGQLSVRASSLTCLLQRILFFLHTIRLIYHFELILLMDLRYLIWMKSKGDLSETWTHWTKESEQITQDIPPQYSRDSANYIAVDSNIKDQDYNRLTLAIRKNVIFDWQFQRKGENEL